MATRRIDLERSLARIDAPAAAHARVTITTHMPGSRDPSPFSRPKPLEDPAVRHERIARAAYERANRRGFAPGHELDDWLAAERELYSEDLQ